MSNQQIVMHKPMYNASIFCPEERNSRIRPFQVVHKTCFLPRVKASWRNEHQNKFNQLCKYYVTIQKKVTNRWTRYVCLSWWYPKCLYGHHQRYLHGHPCVQSPKRTIITKQCLLCLFQDCNIEITMQESSIISFLPKWRTAYLQGNDQTVCCV